MHAVHDVGRGEGGKTCGVVDTRSYEGREGKKEGCRIYSVVRGMHTKPRAHLFLAGNSDLLIQHSVMSNSTGRIETPISKRRIIPWYIYLIYLCTLPTFPDVFRFPLSPLRL